MLLMLAERERVDVRVYTHPGCSYANLLGPTPSNCLPFVKAATESVLENARPGDVVFFAALRMPRLVGL